MEQSDMRALVRVAERLGPQIDLELLLHGLLRQGFLRQQEHDRLVNVLSGNTSLSRRWGTVLQSLSESVTLEGLVFGLRDVGMDDLAQTVLDERFQSPNVKISNCICENDSHLKALYLLIDTKRTSGSVRVSMRVDFQDMTSYFISELKSTSRGDVRNRQRYLDCLAVVARVRDFTLDRQCDREAVLQEILATRDSHPDLDHTISTALALVTKVYIARNNMTLADGESHLSDLRQLCHHSNSDLLRYILSLTEQAFYRTMYAERGDRLNQLQSLSACENALEASVRFPQDKPTLEVFLHLSKTMTLLKFSPNFQVDPSTRLSATDTSAARGILQTIAPKYTELDSLDKVMYRVCMARAYDQDNPRLAMSNLEMALALKHSTSLKESQLTNLKIYRDYLASRV